MEYFLYFSESIKGLMCILLLGITIGVVIGRTVKEINEGRRR